jgi:hypothetical protein
MRYLTYQFAHLETLERARRWLAHVGFDPSQIEVVTGGIPRITVRVQPGQAAEVARIIDAVELSDPNSFPSFWDLARQEHIHTHQTAPPAEGLPEAVEPRTFLVGYRVPDARSELGTSVIATAMREAYEGRLGD